MSPALRLSFSLVASLLLWLPTIPAALASNEDPARIALRYLLALVVSRIGVGLLFRIVNSYAATVQHDDPEAQDDAEEAAQADDGMVPFGRRRSDAADEAPPAGPSTEESLLDDALDEVRDTNALVS